MRHTFGPEQKIALEAWARRQREIETGEVQPSNVYELEARR